MAISRLNTSTIKNEIKKYNNFDSGIIRDSLLISVDAGLSSSYGGSGTQWFDLSGNSRTITIIGPTYSSAEGGKFNFNGTSHYMSLPDFNLTNTFTVGAWIKTTHTDFAQIMARGGSTNDRGVYMSMNFGTTTISGGGNNGDANYSWNARDISTVLVNDNKWHYVVATFNQTTNQVTGYVDSVKGLTQHVRMLNDGYSPNNAKIGRNQTGGSQWFGGDMSVFHMYNKILSDEEILINFNATRGRYGV
jgi:hypothetical protein